jgi:deoxyribonuclease (pyrimidine dimer)
MTRINLIDPQELTDQHLNAERREIRLLCANLKRTLNSKSGFVEKKVPAQFTLNAGHCYFFYNKGKYLQKRYESLTQEMLRRNFNPDLSLHFPSDVWPPSQFKDWQPSERDKNVVRERIALRISERPGWYRKCGELIDDA